MDFNSLSTFIGSIGFPCAMCIWMFKELGELRKVIEANTLISQRLYDKLGDDHNENK